MARKRTRKEARERLRDLPEIPIPPVLRKFPGGRAAKPIERTSRFLAERLVAKDPLDRLGGRGADIFNRRLLAKTLSRLPPTQDSPPPTRSFGGGGSDKPFDGLKRSVEKRAKQKQEITKMADADEIIDAFLMGVAEGAREGASRIFPSPEQAGRSIGRRAISGRSRSADPFGLLRMEALLAELEQEELIEPKPKRKQSKYNKELSRQLKQLKKEKPRTPQNKLMKEAHKRTRKALGMTKNRRKR